ncbi:MAG TPA: hypothetical protein VLY23_17160 [Candidatus Acidoferrum sp.]|nr:hypothetical protein [Candidatus Acidoferrum sp.]
MPVIFILARDWTLRTALRAELRELGIDALGMDSPEDAGRALAAGQVPAVVVAEATADLISGREIQNLLTRVPSILIASRTEKIPVPVPQPGETAPRRILGTVVYRPVRIGEIVSRVRSLLEKGQAA